jgi:hypothetical protein
LKFVKICDLDVDENEKKSEYCTFDIFPFKAYQGKEGVYMYFDEVEHKILYI